MQLLSKPENKKNVYVDRCLRSVPTETATIRLVDQLRELLSTPFPESENLCKNVLVIEAEHGVQWNIQADTFGFKIVDKKRSAIKMYDPQGFIYRCLPPAKAIALEFCAALEQSSKTQWRYAETAFNPADEATRGFTIQDFLHDARWIRRPLKNGRKHQQIWQNRTQ
ncbi:hypothetical protein P5673_011991 [Acropora cervicornis]|uniref:Uncharacterized protein n=1 Tax=Acropora cervicornis TaxID=6130 RepID=A0AAD9V7U8_ACRCE|nr:hypothetical protein P5673_011991 [Acropora cervicornis]